MTLNWYILFPTTTTFLTCVYQLNLFAIKLSKKSFAWLACAVKHDKYIRCKKVLHAKVLPYYMKFLQPLISQISLCK